MSLVPHTVTALAKSDSEGTGGSNIIAGAVVTMTDSSGDAAIMYDDALGSNGSTAKQTNSNGYVVVFLEPGTYTQTVNGSGTRVVVADYVGENVTEQRDKLGLGTAATYDVGTGSGDVMVVGTRGWSGYTPTLLGDFDEIFTTPLPSGFYRWDVTTLNVPDDMTINGHVTVGYRSETSAVIRAVGTDGSSCVGNFSTTTLPSSQGWRYLYDSVSGNTNFNTYTLIDTDTWRAMARSSGAVNVWIQVPFNPTSVTVTGTFDVIELSASTVVASGITPTLSADSSNAFAVLRFAGSFTAGLNYVVRANGGATTATVEINS